MTTTSDKLYKLKKSILIWIKDSPSDVMLIIGVLACVTFFSVILTFKLMFKENLQFSELPAVQNPSSMQTGWKFISRNAVGRDYCDTYQKYTAYQVRCYTKNDSGKWVLKDIY